MSAVASRPFAVMAVAALLCGLLTAAGPPPARAEAAATVTLDGPETVDAGEVSRASVHLELDQRVGLGRGHPLRLSVRLTNEGNPVPGAELGYQLPDGDAAVTTTDADGMALIPADGEDPLALDDTSALLADGIDLEVTTTQPAGRYVLAAQLVEWEQSLRRRAGSSRIDTAVAGAEAAFGPGTPVVYVATAGAFPDALAGGAAAVADEAPILLTNRDALPTATRVQLLRLAPDTVVVLGGPAAVSDAVVAELEATTDGEVVRRAGATRTETAVEVSRAGWPDGADAVVIAAADRFADALTGGSVAARMDAPILLVASDSVPGPVAEELSRLAPDTVVLVGGTAVLSDGVEAELARLTGAETVRHAGATRYATNAAALAATTPTAAGGVLVAATGEAFPDALAGVALAGATGGSLVLVRPDGVPAEVEEEVTRIGPDRIELLGGTAAVDAAVADTLAGLTLPRDVTVGRLVAGRAVTDFEVNATADQPAPAPRPVVSITSPTTADPAELLENRPLDITFSTTIAGTYTVTLSGDADPTTVATGTAPVGATTVGINAPGKEGAYDLSVTVVSGEERTGRDTEVDAIIVADDPVAPDVQIVSPTGDEPASVTAGSDVPVTFAVDRAGTYAIQYSADGGATWTAFPLGGGVATQAGQITRTVRAPGDPVAGVYDLRVAFTATDTGLPASDREAGAIVVAPSLLSLGASHACTLGRNDPSLPGAPGLGGDPLDPAHCLLPFPNDYFTVPALTDTGLRLDLLPTAMPRNQAGKLVDPTEWNRNDGFSPGSMITTVVPDLDLAQTWDPDDPAAHQDLITTPSRSVDPDAPIVVINADTGEPHPFWAELDSHPVTLDGGWPRTLIIRPLVHFEEGQRYIVGLRNMRDGDGNVIPAGEAFAHYRDSATADGSPYPGDLAFEARRGRVRAIIDTLEAETTVDRATDELFLAWDFTVASADNLAGRALAIRDDAFAGLGDTDLADGVVDGTSPALTITDVIPQEGDGRALRIEGTVAVPLYLRGPQDRLGAPDDLVCATLDGLPIPSPIDELTDLLIDVCGEKQAAPGSRFYYASPTDETPSVNPLQETYEARFICTVADTEDGSPTPVSMYGHGLLGSVNESTGSSPGELRRAHDYTFCGMDWIGMASEDLANVVTILTEYSNMPSLPDRAQQGFLNFMFMARALIHPDGALATQAADGTYPFRTGGTADGAPLIDTSQIVYDGNSQGGIMGGALVALSPDIRRGTLGVPGTNYSTLLNRSVDWEGVLGETVPPEPIPFDGVGFATVYYTAYPDKVEQQIGFTLLQMLWDRGEGNGYAAHMTDDPYPNTPDHRLLLHPAFGDYQVANISAEVLARTAGAGFLSSSLEPGLHWADDPLFGFEDLTTFPHAGSALVYFDSGNPVPPNGNVPPLELHQDPHSDPRKDPDSGDQRARFFATGEVVDVHDGQPYYSYRFPERACNDEGIDPRGICPG